MNILDLPEWDVLQRKTDPVTGDYTFTAQPMHPPRACPGCGVLGAALYKFGTRPIEIRDLPMHGQKVTIRAARRRYRCRECQYTFSEPLPNVDEHHRATERLVQWVAHQSLSRTFTGIAQEIGVSEITVRRIFQAHVDALNAKWEQSVVTPRVLGIDELLLAGDMRCILTNVEEASAVDLLPRRTIDVVEARLRRFDPTVDVVVMDMYRGYRDAARRVFPKAAIVVDKFHVERMATQALDVVRKGIRAGLTERQRRQLKRDRHLLLNRPYRLTPQDRLILESWTGSYPRLKEAYDLKERFHRIYDANARTRAETLLDEWLDSIPDDMRPAFRHLMTAVNNWRPYILAYFDHRVTNAYTEALNGLAKMANRQGRGYAFEAIRAKLLFHIGLRKTPKAAPPPEPTGPSVEHIFPASVVPADANLLWMDWRTHSLYGADMAAHAELIQNSLDAFIGGEFSTDEDEDGDDEK